MHNRPTKETALSAYVAAIAEIHETLTALLSHADDHLGTAPEDVNWGHVGNANYISEQLAEIARFLGLRQEGDNSGHYGKVRRHDGRDVVVYIPGKEDDQLLKVLQIKVKP